MSIFIGFDVDSQPRQTHNSRSFRDIVGFPFQMASAQHIPSDPPQHPSLEVPVITVNEDILDCACSRHHRLSLIGKIGGGFIPARILKQKLPALWRMKGSLEVLDLTHNFFLFHFGVEADLLFARAGSPWTVARKKLLMTGWIPNFDPTRAYIASFPVWVQLPSLPIEYWEEEILRQIVAPLGFFVKIDKANKTCGRSGAMAAVAHVLVEMGLDKALVPGARLQHRNGTRFQPFKFENLPRRCEICRKYKIGGSLSCGCCPVAQANLNPVINLQTQFGEWLEEVQDHKGTNMGRGTSTCRLTTTDSTCWIPSCLDPPQVESSRTWSST